MLHDGMKDGEFTMHPLTEDIIWIDDGKLSSLYVIKGDGAAMIVDTGMGDGNEYEYIRENITKDPYKLVITHGHLDHVMKAYDFDKFYMSALDDSYLDRFPQVKIENRIDIQPGDKISVPGVTLVAVPAPGHTIGSYIFVDVERKAVYTGDAYGSGWGMLLNLPGSTTVKEYRDGAIRCLEMLEELGVDESFAFYGGHLQQKYENERMELNVPDINMIRDVVTLCDKVMSGEIVGHNEGKFRPDHTEDTYFAGYGTADFMYLRSRIQ